MKRVVALVAMVVGLHVAYGQEIQLQFDSSEFSPASGPLILTLASPFDGGLPVETEYAVQSPTIQSALELTDEQVRRIRKDIQSVNEKFQPQYERVAASTDDEEAKSKLTEEVRAKHRKAIELAVDEILLPHQAFRLKQLQNRGRMQTSLNNSEYSQFQDLLDLTADQKKKLAEKSVEMREKLKAEIQELKQKRSQEVLESVLTDEQRAKLKEVLGEPVSRTEKK